MRSLRRLREGLQDEYRSQQKAEQHGVYPLRRLRPRLSGKSTAHRSPGPKDGYTFVKPKDSVAVFSIFFMSKSTRFATFAITSFKMHFHPSFVFDIVFINISRHISVFFRQFLREKTCCFLQRFLFFLQKSTYFYLQILWTVV